MKSILSNIKQLLFSRTSANRDIISNSSVACVNLIKCMEFYNDKGCDADLDHWISVATSGFDKMLSDRTTAYGCFLIFPSQSKNLIKSLKLSENSKYSSPIEAIRAFKHEIETVNGKNGVSKYSDLLERDNKGKVQWKHSDKYYEKFFEILGYLLNFQISLYDLQGVFIDEDGKLWGGRIIPKNPVSILDSGISKYDFQTLIYRYIYLMNYEQLNGNKELAKRI